MAQDYTTTNLLASLKRRGMLPTTTTAWTTADYLGAATEELQSYMTGLLVRAKEEFSVETYDVTMVAGQDTYAIPPRAAGDKLRQVLILVQTQYFPLSRIGPEMVHTQGTMAGAPTGFYFQGDNLILVPMPTSGSPDSLRLKYFRRPGSLVLTSACAQIQAIASNRLSTTATATIPGTMASGAVLDVVKATPSFGTLAMDLVATTGTTGTTVVFTTALPAQVAVGDWVCMAGEAPVPQLAPELHPLLVQRTKAAVLDALGDPQANIAYQLADKMEKEIWPFLQNRSEGNARCIVNRYGPGFSRLRGFRK